MSRSAKHLLSAFGGVITAALVLVLSAGSSSASTAATTIFKGRFVCTQDLGSTLDIERPLASARVQLMGGPRPRSSGAGIWGLFGLGLDEHAAFTVRGTTYAGPQGEWSFTVPRTKSTNYFLVATLDDGRGTLVTRFPSADPVAATPGSGGTNFDDVPLHDFHTQSYPGDECALWLALRDASQGYARLMGKRPPYGSVVAQYDAPNAGVPYAAYTTIVWPKGYPVGVPAARHEFAHTIRNVSLGSENAFLDEVSQEDFRLPGDPCRRTTPQYAFHEGWAGFWAGDYRPAPKCPGVRPDDSSVEGNVAWTLTSLERNCTEALAGRKRMVEVLLARGKSIHSLSDFVGALGVGSASCLGAPLDPDSVPRTTAAPPVPGNRWQRDLQSAVTAARHRKAQLTALLPGADRAAVSARCPRPPCLEAVGRRLAPSLIRGQIAQARAAASMLQTEMSIDAQSLRTRPTRRFLESVTRTPRRLASTMAKIGVDSIDEALANARPLARRDHTDATRSVFAFFRSRRGALAKAARSHVGSQHVPPPTCGWVQWIPSIYLCSGGLSTEKKTRTIPTDYEFVLRFEDYGGGTITTQTAKDGVVFGSASALAFRGRLPDYVCAEGPIGRGYMGAETQACGPGGTPFHFTGTLARLRFPARSVGVDVGATAVTRGGIPVEVDGFDAAGEVVSRTAVLAGAEYDDRTWDKQLLKLVPPLQSHPIAYVAIYVNSSILTITDPAAQWPHLRQPRILFNTLFYRTKKAS